MFLSEAIVDPCPTLIRSATDLKLVYRVFVCRAFMDYEGVLIVSTRLGTDEVKANMEAGRDWNNNSLNVWSIWVQYAAARDLVEFRSTQTVNSEWTRGGWSERARALAR